MRVVGGTARGRRLELVPGDTTRPILDRVKTSLFDILRPRIEDAVVLDLFAGTGSVGIEALSQGAGRCVFTDRERRAVETIRRNLDHTGLSTLAEVRQTDALGYLRTSLDTFDLIYVAPPQYRELWARALEQIAARPGLLRGPTTDEPENAEPGMVIAQIDPKEYRALDLGDLVEQRRQRYGNTLLVFYQRHERANLPSAGAVDSGGYDQDSEDEAAAAHDDADVNEEGGA